LPMWKTHMFARIPGLEAGGEAQRIQEVRDYEAWMLRVSPDIRTGHPMFTEEAEEDQWLGECTFRKPMPAIMFDAPGYAQWLMQQDPSPAYVYLHRQLQYLQWQTRRLHGAAEAAKPWLLKSPDNFGCETFLTQAFPGMRFVVTHRNPVECVASAAVMTKQFRRLYSDHYDPRVLAGSLVPMLSQMAQAHLAWRGANLGAQVFDLGFRQITRDGLGTARKVYDYLGMELTPSAERAMGGWEADNGQDKHGKNVYSLDDIGAAPEHIRAAFSGYLARYAEYL
ncbi:MAG: Sulfotransferase, partial [Nevskia sp.]|nr:Sulfotransferase [Nevskia sp.]